MMRAERVSEHAALTNSAALCAKLNPNSKKTDVLPPFNFEALEGLALLTICYIAR